MGPPTLDDLTFLKVTLRRAVLGPRFRVFFQGEVPTPCFSLLPYGLPRLPEAKGVLTGIHSLWGDGVL